MFYLTKASSSSGHEINVPSLIKAKKDFVTDRMKLPPGSTQGPVRFVDEDFFLSGFVVSSVWHGDNFVHSQNDFHRSIGRAVGTACGREVAASSQVFIWRFYESDSVWCHVYLHENRNWRTIPRHLEYFSASLTVSSLRRKFSAFCLRR